MPIHLQAQPGDYAPTVIIPGDPIRATKIAARFDGGLENTRQVNANRGLVGYTGTVDGVPVSVQVTMMGSPTTGIVVEELLMLGVQTFIRVGTTGAFPPLQIGDVVVAMASAGWTGFANVVGAGEPTAPTADLDVVIALRDAARTAGLTTHVGPIMTSDTFYGDPDPAGVTRWGRRGYLSVEMESAALFLLAMRERAQGRPVRAGSILTVSDVLFYPDSPEAGQFEGKPFYRPPEDEVNARVDKTIGAALSAAAALGRPSS
jgi:DeoD family purine-nucleoside phosphorylase